MERVNSVSELQADLLERIESDLLDGYDEELELEFEGCLHHVDPVEVVLGFDVGLDLPLW